MTYKFNSAEAMLCYSASLESWQDDSCGSSTEEGCWHGLFRGTTFGPEDSFWSEVVDEYGHEATVEAAEGIENLPSGGIILTEDSQGFVSAEIFPYGSELFAQWALHQEEHQGFDTEIDDDEEATL